MRTKKTVYFGIYEIKNLINGKSYIGQSATDVHGRCNKHIKLLNSGYDNKHLVNAVNKYGIDNFSFNVILYCEEFELLRYEDALINTDRRNRYNIRDAAGSNKGLRYTQSDIAKHNMSIARKGMTLSDEHKHKISISGTGKKRSEATKHAISKSLTGRKLSDVHKSKLSAWQVGRTLPEETKHKLSLINIGRVVSDDIKHKISVSNKGKHHNLASEETKRKMAASHTGLKASQETKDKMSKSRLARIKLEKSNGTQE